MTARLLAMGDVHGQYEKMMRVLTKVNYDSVSDSLILLGDYVDRGPASRRVMEAVIKLVADGAVALYGNHEDLMLAAFAGRQSGVMDSLAVEQWFANGGETTLAAYRTATDVLQAHLAVLRDLPRWHEEAGFLFVHAGIRPGRTLDKQAESDLIWLREEYILGYAGPPRVVAGHTPIQYLKRFELFPDIADATLPLSRPWQVFLDTGAAWGGPLTVMDLLTEQYWQA